MANGQEDLEEKNKDKRPALKKGQYSEWKNFQGREDAEMLYEKHDGWTSARSQREWERMQDSE